VFAIDYDGNLEVISFVQNGSTWTANGPKLINVGGVLPSNAPLAASQQFGLTQTDVFAVDGNSLRSVAYLGPNGWVFLQIP
jgi:hypothetical protein